MFMDQKTYIVKMPILPNMIYQFNTIPNQNPSGFFCMNSQANPKIRMEYKGPWGTKTVLKKKNKYGGFIFPSFKASYNDSYGNQDSVLLV